MSCWFDMTHSFKSRISVVGSRIPHFSRLKWTVNCNNLFKFSFGYSRLCVTWIHHSSRQLKFCLTSGKQYFHASKAKKKKNNNEKKLTHFRLIECVGTHFFLAITFSSFSARSVFHIHLPFSFSQNFKWISHRKLVD